MSAIKHSSPEHEFTSLLRSGELQRLVDSKVRELREIPFEQFVALPEVSDEIFTVDEGRFVLMHSREVLPTGELAALVILWKTGWLGASSVLARGGTVRMASGAARELSAREWDEVL